MSEQGADRAGFTFAVAALIFVVLTGSAAIICAVAQLLK